MERDQRALGRSRLKVLKITLGESNLEIDLPKMGSGRQTGVKFFAVMKEQSQSINRIRKNFISL